MRPKPQAKLESDFAASSISIPMTEAAAMHAQAL